MKTYVVLYRVYSLAGPMEDPFGFVCQAEDEDHAEEQTLNMEPKADIVWVYEGGEYIHEMPNEEKFEIERKLVDAAYDDYFNAGQAEA